MLHMFHSSIIGIFQKDTSFAMTGTMTLFRQRNFGKIRKTFGPSVELQYFTL